MDIDGGILIQGRTSTFGFFPKQDFSFILVESKRLCNHKPRAELYRAMRSPVLQRVVYIGCPSPSLTNIFWHFDLPLIKRWRSSCLWHPDIKFLHQEMYTYFLFSAGKFFFNIGHLTSPSYISKFHIMLIYI